MNEKKMHFNPNVSTLFYKASWGRDNVNDKLSTILHLGKNIVKVS